MIWVCVCCLLFSWLVGSRIMCTLHVDTPSEKGYEPVPFLKIQLWKFAYLCVSVCTRNNILAAHPGIAFDTNNARILFMGSIPLDMHSYHDMKPAVIYSLSGNGGWTKLRKFEWSTFGSLYSVRKDHPQPVFWFWQAVICCYTIYMPETQNQRRNEKRFPLH